MEGAKIQGPAVAQQINALVIKQITSSQYTIQYDNQTIDAIYTAPNPQPIAIGKHICFTPQVVEKEGVKQMQFSAYTEQQEVRMPQANEDCMPITHITSNTEKFTIKGRVVRKKDIRSFKTKANSEMKCMKFEIADADSSIEITCFNQLADKYQNYIEIGKVYKVKNGNVQLANKKYTTAKNDYAITIGESTIITLCGEDASLQMYTFNFTPINMAVIRESGFLDVIGIVVSCGESQEVTTKTGKANKRILSITDESKIKLDITLWNEAAHDKQELNSIIAVKEGKVNIYNNYFNLSVSNSTSIVKKPEGKRTTELIQYLATKPVLVEKSVTKKGGANEQPVKRSNISEIKRKFEHSFDSEKVLYSINGEIQMVSAKKTFYMACPDCRKGTKDDSKGVYFCEKCQKTVTPHPTLLINFLVSDQSGSMFVVAVGDVCEKLFQLKATDAKKMKDNKEDVKLIEKLNLARYKPIEMIIRPQKAQTRELISYNLAKANEVNYVSESIALIGDIESMMNNLQ